jgi:aminopeptidase N
MKPCDGIGGRAGAVLFLAVWAVCAPRPAGAQPERYVLDVRVDPERGHLSASARVSVQVADGASSISFDLHETFRILECAVDERPVRCTRTEPPPPGGAPASRKLTVELPSGSRRDLVHLAIRYEGKLRNLPSWGQPDAQGPFMDDALTPDRVELALYSAWYPSFGFGPTFDVDLDLAIPRGWGFTCIGVERHRQESSTETRTRWEARSVNDVVVVASPRLRSKEIETPAGRVVMHHTRLPGAFVLKEGRETERTLRLFTEVLGPPSGGGTVQHVYSPREWGQGFARPGLIVVSEGRVLRSLEEDPATSFLHDHAHEAGHFWWRFGAGQGDWINETFAEYFSLLAVRSLLGEDEFRKILDRERQDVRGLPADAPALAVVPFRNDGPGYTIRYHKGALMLDAFRRRLGDEPFFEACRRFYERIRGRSVGTSDFRAHWREGLGNDELLSAWLDSPGSAPVPPVQ